MPVPAYHVLVLYEPVVLGLARWALERHEHGQTARFTVPVERGWCWRSRAGGRRLVEVQGDLIGAFIAGPGSRIGVR